MGTVVYDEDYRVARLASIDDAIEANKRQAEHLAETRKQYLPAKKSRAGKADES